MNIPVLLKREKPILDEKAQMTKELIQQLRDIEIQIKANESVFDTIVEDALIEAIIYENQALRVRYGHYIKMAKEYGITYPPKVSLS